MLRSQSEGITLHADYLISIGKTLNLTSIQELLSEFIALENERIKAEENQEKGIWIKFLVPLSLCPIFAIVRLSLRTLSARHSDSSIFLLSFIFGTHAGSSHCCFWPNLRAGFRSKMAGSWSNYLSQNWSKTRTQQSYPQFSDRSGDRTSSFHTPSTSNKNSGVSLSLSANQYHRSKQWLKWW